MLPVKRFFEIFYEEREYMKRGFHLLILGGLIFLLTACTLGKASTPTSVSTASPSPRAPTATPTPSVPSGTILFQSDWSHGLAAWDASPGWKVVNGTAQSNLSENNTLTVPYHLTVQNYAIEYRFRILNVPRNGGFFIVRAGRTPDKNGYTAGILNLLGPGPRSEFANPQIQIYLDPLGAMEDPDLARPSDYEAGTFWHTFRVEVQGSQASFLADGFRKGLVVSSQTNWLSNGPLQLICTGAVVQVASVRLIAL
jgi:hypothetical protein